MVWTGWACRGRNDGRRPEWVEGRASGVPKSVKKVSACKCAGGQAEAGHPAWPKEAELC